MMLADNSKDGEERKDVSDIEEMMKMGRLW